MGGDGAGSPMVGVGEAGPGGQCEGGESRGPVVGRRPGLGWSLVSILYLGEAGRYFIWGGIWVSTVVLLI